MTKILLVFWYLRRLTLKGMLTLSAHASKGALVEAIFAHLGILVGMVLSCHGGFVCYAYAQKITVRVSQQIAHGILRVIAFVLLCIGVHIAWNGLSALITVGGLRLR